MDSFFLDFNKEGYVNGVSLNYLGTGYDEGVEPDDAPNYDKILYGNTRLLRNVLLFTKKDEFDILGTNSNQGLVYRYLVKFLLSYSHLFRDEYKGSMYKPTKINIDLPDIKEGLIKYYRSIISDNAFVDRIISLLNGDISLSDLYEFIVESCDLGNDKYSLARLILIELGIYILDQEPPDVYLDEEPPYQTLFLTNKPIKDYIKIDLMNLDRVSKVTNIEQNQQVLSSLNVGDVVTLQMKGISNYDNYTKPTIERPFIDKFILDKIGDMVILYSILLATLMISMKKKFMLINTNYISQRWIIWLYMVTVNSH